VRLARTWARLETYIPYMWDGTKSAGPAQKARVGVRLAPRALALAALRLYAAAKLRKEERAATPPAPHKVRVVAGQGLIPLPIIQPDRSAESLPERGTVGAPI